MDETQSKVGAIPEIRTVAMIGAGTMGWQITARTANTGRPVTHYDADPAATERALALQADMLYTDPPTYPRPFLESAGKRALRNRDFKTAEARYRKLLEREPGGGRALSGLADALTGEGKTSEAESVRADFQKAWARADSTP